MSGGKRPPYLLAGGDTRHPLQEKVAILWDFGYRPHGSPVVSLRGNNCALIQPMVYEDGYDSRKGETIPLELI